MALIPIAVALVYARTLPAPFFFDDASVVLLNPTIQSLRPLDQVLVGTRPVLNLSFAVSYSVGQRSPWWHRLANVILHGANALLVYTLLRLALNLPGFRGPPGPKHGMALTIALLFALHPLQTESVTYISGRAEALAGFFVLSGMVCLALALQPSREYGAAALRIAAVACAAAGMLSKESAAVSPLLFLSFESLATGSFSRVWRAHPLTYGLLAATWLIPAVILLTHPEYANTAGFGFGSDPFGITWWEYFCTQPGVVLHYLRLALLPYGQTFDYDWPLAHSAFATSVLIPAALVLALLGVAVTLRRKAPLYAFAILWFFLTLAPTSSIVPIADVIAERRMYLPLVGVLIGLVLMTTTVARAALAADTSRIVTAAAATSAVVCLASLTLARNSIWSDPLSLWLDSVEKAPLNPRPHINLGIRYLQRGDVQSARTELEAAIDLVEQGRSQHAIPRHAAFAASHLALVYLQLGDASAAGEAYTAALELGAEAYPELSAPLRQARMALGRLGFEATKPQ